MSVFGLVLAGGTGNRLGGVDKARLRINGETQLVTVIKRVSAQVSSIALSTGASTAQFATDLECLSDPFTPQIGPLGGMYAGGLWANEQSSGISSNLLLVVPVDSPDFPTDFVTRAEPLLQDADVVVGAFDEQTYPVCSLWRVSAALQIERTRESAKNNSIRGFLDTIRVRYIDYQQFSSDNPFKNVNNISDLLTFSVR